MAQTSTALITLAKVKLYLGITDENSDRILEAMIDRATGFMERYCNRKLYTRSYTREVYYGSGFQKLVLDQYPVTTVSRVSSGRANAFYVTNTTATNHATIEITSSALKYSADGAAATSLAFATYTTINLLIAALNAISGWSATVMASSYGTRKSSDLLIRPGMYCLSPTQAYCEIPNDEMTDYQLLSPSEDRNCGILYSPSGWTRGTEYFVDYTAGYTTVPLALEEAVLLLVAYRYNQKDQDQSIKQESMGDYSYTLRDMANAIPSDIGSLIDLYRKRTL